ncbi:MAG: hypothetical protein KGZ79_04375 [Dethiobacter sp.]|nr:hypothetical protein [Dethiobacter sp.]
MFRQMVEKMKSAAKFLSNPIIQYIPISIRTLGSNSNWANPFSHTNQQIFIFQDPLALQSALSRYGITAQAPHPGNDMYVLALNFQAEIVLFRYLTCKIIGRSTPGSSHVFAITKKYFPRRVIHFAIYENNGVRLGWVNQEIY